MQMEEIIIYKVLNDPIFLKMKNLFKKIIDLSNMKTEKVKRNEKAIVLLKKTSYKSL